MEKVKTNSIIKPRIAIIGSGICGTTSAYYLNQRFKNLDITIFEKKNIVGGRTKSLEFEGHQVNLGAGFFIEANLNLISLMKKYGIDYSLSLKDKQSRLAWDGNTIAYNSKSWLSSIKFPLLYGWSLFKLKRFLSSRIKEFMTLYPKLLPTEETGFAFENSSEFLKFINCEQEINKTGQNLATQIGVSQSFIDVFLYGMVRGIYNNNINNINGFAMMITLQGMFQKAYSAKLGSDHLIKTMLLEKNDFCDLKINSPVKNVHFESESKKYRVEFLENGVDSKSEMFDVVILATPFNYSKIQFANVELPPGMGINRQNKKVVVTIVEGKVRNAFFGLKKEDPPVESLLLMKDSEARLESINSFDQSKVLGNGLFLYRLESDSPVSDGLLNKLFEEGKVVTKQTWDFAYPELKPMPADQIPPFRLAHGLYFPNAIEFTASCMELQTLSAQNIVKLIGKHEGKMWTTNE